MTARCGSDCFGLSKRACRPSVAQRIDLPCEPAKSASRVVSAWAIPHHNRVKVGMCSIDGLAALDVLSARQARAHLDLAGNGRLRHRLGRTARSPARIAPGSTRQATTRRRSTPQGDRWAISWRGKAPIEILRATTPRPLTAADILDRPGTHLARSVPSNKITM
jgi:hypothetical protein